VFVANFRFAAIYYGSLQASKKLHNGELCTKRDIIGNQSSHAAMLETVLLATLRFHDTTSRGRLLNRFGKDIEGLDSSMADNCACHMLCGMRWS
jgi:hypothetical protein